MQRWDESMSFLQLLWFWHVACALHCYDFDLFFFLVFCYSVPLRLRKPMPSLSLLLATQPCEPFIGSDHFPSRLKQWGQMASLKIERFPIQEEGLPDNIIHIHVAPRKPQILPIDH